MGAPGRKVWELVHSLTKSENERFYDRAFEYKRGGYAQYTILYDALRRQKVFDEDELRETLKNEKFLVHLHRVKYYLYGKILKFLRDSEEEGETKLFAYLGNIKFLLGKRLFLHIPDQIEKAIKLAEETEDFLSHLKILKYQRELINVSKNWGFDAGEIREVHENETKLRQLDTERFELQKLLDTFKGVSRVSSMKEEINIIESQLTIPQSKTGLILYCRIRINIALRTGRYADCILETDRIISIFQNSKGLLQNDSYYKDLVMAIYHGAMVRSFIGKFEEADNIMKALEGELNTKNRLPSLYYELKILHELGIGMASLNFPRIWEAIKSYYELPESMLANIDWVKKIEILHIAANASIIDEKPKDTLKYINSIANIKPAYLRLDIRQFSRILFLVAHYDLGNLDVIETGVRAARISFKRKKVENAFYTGVLKMFSKITRANSIEKKKLAMREFLAGFTGDSAQSWNRMNQYFNIKAWLISKIKQQSLLTILREKDEL
ncbi:MAG TPA: hypothetical protein ENJ82_01305 [Bacteroidetes bacterium]|nr:hypothetical protein [Bacteroidota bacterium]